MTDEQILGFDPSQLDIFNKQETKSYDRTNFITSINEWERKLNYPIKNYYKEGSEEIYDAKTAVMYVYNQLYKNSIESISWLRSSQYAKKSEKEDKAHENKCLQILTTEFQIIFITKINEIVELTNRIYEKTDTYSWEYSYYKYIKDKFVKYISGKTTDNRTKFQIDSFVDGLMKITLSATWDYDSKSFICENKPFSNKYTYCNGKWIKMHG